MENVKAELAEDSIITYVQALFNRIFQGKARDSYVLAREDGLENLRFEIIGSPEFFHQLHWENLKDPDMPTPFVLEAPMIKQSIRFLSLIDKCYMIMSMTKETRRE